MNRNPSEPAPVKALTEPRRRGASQDWSSYHLADAYRLIHELQLRQLDLEARNRELERYATYYESAPVPCLTVGDDGMILDANLAAVRLFGRERLRLVGQPILQVVCAPDHFDLRLSDGQPVTCELNGTARKVELHASALPDGQAYCVLFVEPQMDEAPARPTERHAVSDTEAQGIRS